MTYRMLGLMSGTSLDGLDLCRCDLRREGDQWSYDIIAARTVAYSSTWRRRLDAAIDRPRSGLADLDLDYGRYLGQAAREFLVEIGDAGAVTVASRSRTHRGRALRRVRGLKPIFHLDEPGHRRAAGVALQQAFLPREPPRHDGAVLVGDLLEVVD